MSALSIVLVAVIPAIGVLFGIGVATVRGIIRMAQYLAHSEESLDKVADSNERISERLGRYIEQNDKRQAEQDTAIALLQFAMSGKAKA